MQQIVDLQNDPEFQSLDVAFVSIAFDPSAELAAGAAQYGTDIPLLTDADHSVSEAYDVLQWAAATGEPSHTFVLVDQSGEVAWIRDYGSPQNEGVMYVDPGELVTQIADSLAE